MQISSAKIAVAEIFITDHACYIKGTEQLPKQDSSKSILPENYFNQKSKPKSNPGHFPQRGFRSHR